MTDRKEIIELVAKIDSLPMRQAFIVTDEDGYIDCIEYTNLLRPPVNMTPIAFAEMARAI